MFFAFSVISEPLTLRKLQIRSWRKTSVNQCYFEKNYFCRFITLSMGLMACNSAGHLSNHVDIAPRYAGTTFAISNTIATIPGIFCGHITAELVTLFNNHWYPVFILAVLLNFFGAIVYSTKSAATPIPL